MNVFVETNFVIELALEQQQAPACESLLKFAEDHSIDLLVPSYCFIEPHETLKRRHLERARLRSRISSELTQLARSAPLAERVATSEEVVRLLIDSIAYENRRIELVKERIWSAAQILPLDLDRLRDAAAIQRTFSLSPQDAVVYACIRGRLVQDHQSQSCFVSRNPADFDDPALQRDLADLNCKYFSSFRTANQYIRHTLAQ